MAKSLRSKRKRKVRAEKRIVNAKKELVKLREVAAKLHGSDKKSLEASIPDVMVSEGLPEDVAMSVGENEPSAGKKRITINNQWMNQRKIKSIKNKIKAHNQKKARRSKPAGLSSRKAKKGRK